VLSHVPTQDQLADIFTKPLDQATFVRLRGGTWGLLPFLVDSWGFYFCTICIIPCFSFDVCTCFACCINHGRIAILLYIMLLLYHIAF
jgi:hypothetical protein